LHKPQIAPPPSIYLSSTLHHFRQTIKLLKYTKQNYQQRAKNHISPIAHATAVCKKSENIQQIEMTQFTIDHNLSLVAYAKRAQKRLSVDTNQTLT
jgi:hypothetical protein